MATNKYKIRAKYGCWLCKEYEDNNNFCPYEECKYENDLKKYESYSDYEKDRKIADIGVILGLKSRKERNSMDVGTVIEKYRKRSGLTQKELADIAGFHLNSIQHWETGRTMPTTDRFITLLSAMGYGIKIVRED